MRTVSRPSSISSRITSPAVVIPCVKPDCNFGSCGGNGAGDDVTKFFDPHNNFFYLTAGRERSPAPASDLKDGSADQPDLPSSRRRSEMRWTFRRRNDLRPRHRQQCRELDAAPERLVRDREIELRLRFHRPVEIGSRISKRLDAGESDPGHLEKNGSGHRALAIDGRRWISLRHVAHGAAGILVVGHRAGARRGNRTFSSWAKPTMTTRQSAGKRSGDRGSQLRQTETSCSICRMPASTLFTTLQSIARSKRSTTAPGWANDIDREISRRFHLPQFGSLRGEPR